MRKPEWFRNKTTLHRILKWLWIFPGIPVSILFRQSITYLTALSVYAIIASHWAAEEAAPDEPTPPT